MSIIIIWVLIELSRLYEQSIFRMYVFIYDNHPDDGGSVNLWCNSTFSRLHGIICQKAVIFKINCGLHKQNMNPALCVNQFGI